jgi:hypothetical protein
MYNILIEFSIPMKLVRQIKMCVNWNMFSSKVHIQAIQFVLRQAS